MAVVFLVKDGPRGETTNEGYEISVSELSERLSGIQCRFLSREPPQFNTATPSDNFRHVIIQVSAEDEPNEEFDQVGFYVVADLDPIDAHFLIGPRET